MLPLASLLALPPALAQSGPAPAGPAGAEGAACPDRLGRLDLVETAEQKLVEADLDAVISPESS